MKVINKLVYVITVRLAWLISKFIFCRKIHGKENLPKKGPYIFYSNHIAIFDPIITIPINMKNKMYCMGKEELFKSRPLNWFFRAIGGYPVSRGKADMSAVKESISYLKNGNNLMIFPEGTRNTNHDNKLTQFHNGIAIIIFKTGVPAVPCYLEGKNGYIKPFRRLHIHIGKPIDMSKYYKAKVKRESLEECMQLLKVELAGMM